jgi:anti-sigma factor RsiW
MRCEKMKRRISDALDGRLSERERLSLDEHLKICPGCSAYIGGLEKIQKAAEAAVPGPGPEFFDASLARLKSRLKAETVPIVPTGRSNPLSLPRGRWAWAGAVSFFAVALVIFFMVPRIRTAGEAYPLAFDEPLGSFDGQIADNLEVAAEFEKVVRTSLRETAGSRHADIEPLLADHTMLVESLTDDELQALDAALKKEISVKQGRI